jgi:hypothetical protein
VRKSLILSTVFATSVSVVSAILAQPATAGRAPGHHTVVLGRASSAPMPNVVAPAHPRATLSRFTQGLLPSARLAAAKMTTTAAPERTTGAVHAGGATDPAPPTAMQQWDGTHDPTGSPGDATAAVGPSSVVQVVNSRIALYQRSGTYVDGQALATFLGLGQPHCLVEPQVQWDPYTNAYFFALLDLGPTLSGGDCPVGKESLWYGWSKTKNPASLAAGNWCALHYGDYGGDNEIPDSPRLGDTKDFGLIGVNVFGPDTNPDLPYLRSDMVAFPKPLPGHTGTCPGTQTVYRMQNLSAEGNWDGSVDGAGVPAFAPVPVTQTDPSSSGYVVATDFNGSSSAPYYGFKPGGGAYLGNALVVFPVSIGGGVPQLGAAIRIPVGSYLWPTNAHQLGTELKLDTQEGAPTQAMSSVDPMRATPGSEAGAIWTQQVVRGGAGAMITWYELDPTAPAGSQVLQTGTVSNASMWLFNAAISSDRQVATDATGAVTSANFGSAMVIGYDVSGNASYVTAKMVSKIGDGLRSPSATIKTSVGADDDHSCRPVPGHRRCRWGDYAGAVPDPYYAAGSTRGHVWLANQWVTKSGTPDDADWRTVLVRVWP